MGWICSRYTLLTFRNVQQNKAENGLFAKTATGQIEELTSVLSSYFLIRFCFSTGGQRGKIYARTKKKYFSNASVKFFE